MTERYVEAPDGLRLHVVVRGEPTDRPPVLCLPGLTHNERAFEDVAPRLATGRMVAAMSFRGRGRSGRDPTGASYALDAYVGDALAVVDALGWGAAVWLGTSLGGLTALWANWRAPERVAAIVLNDVGVALQREGLERIGAYARIVDPVTSWAAAAGRAKEIGDVVFPDFGPDDWMRVARQRWIETDGGIAPDYDPAIVPGRLPDDDPVLVFTAAAAKPVLLVRGALTDLLAPETVALMRSLAPGMRSVEVPNRGHAPTLTESVAAAALDEFLAAVPEGALE